MSNHKEWYWGHADAEPIDSKEYAKEKDEVSKTIQENHHNPLIQRVLTDLDAWLEEVYNAKYYLYGRFLARLWDVGIRGSDILVETSAITLFAHRNRNRIIDENHFIHVVGNKVIRVVPYRSDTTGPEHKGIGMDVLKHLNGTHLGICKAVIQGQKNASKIKQDMAAPLDI
jgi:hypothetical protein